VARITVWPSKTWSSARASTVCSAWWRGIYVAPGDAVVTFARRLSTFNFHIARSAAGW